MLNLSFSEKQKQVLRKAFDDNGDGSVSFLEFMKKLNSYDDAAWHNRNTGTSMHALFMFICQLFVICSDRYCGQARHHFH
jgi:hypothetical protein